MDSGGGGLGEGPTDSYIPSNCIRYIKLLRDENKGYFTVFLFYFYFLYLFFPLLLPSILTIDYRLT